MEHLIVINRAPGLGHFLFFILTPSFPLIRAKNTESISILNDLTSNESLVHLSRINETPPNSGSSWDYRETGMVLYTEYYSLAIK